MNKTRVVHVNDPGGFDIYIGRAVHRKGFHRSKWANDVAITLRGPRVVSRQMALDAYRAHLEHSPDLLAALPELKGKVLGCWCKPEACHGDLLAELADA